MKALQRSFALMAVLLLVFFPLVAGCLSVPGPESQKKTPTVTAAVTRSPETTAPVTTVVQRTVVTAPATGRTTIPTSGTTTAPIVSRYAADTCTGLGGSLVLPGQTCPGAWLAATNTFSCCSIKPADARGSNKTISAAPFTLTVNIDDTLGSIRP